MSNTITLKPVTPEVIELPSGLANSRLTVAQIGALTILMDNMQIGDASGFTQRLEDDPGFATAFAELFETGAVIGQIKPPNKLDITIDLDSILTPQP